MASKGKGKKAPATMALHCKCDECRAWEFVYAIPDDDNRYSAAYMLVCVTCGEKIPLGGNLYLDPHAKLHWEQV